MKYDEQYGPDIHRTCKKSWMNMVKDNDGSSVYLMSFDVACVSPALKFISKTIAYGIHKFRNSVCGYKLIK